MKKYLIVLIAGLLLSVDSPAQGFFNSLNKALDGLIRDSQQRNRYSDRQRSSYERRQKTENARMKNNEESDRNNRANEAIDEEPPTKMLKEESITTKELEPTAAPQNNDKVITLVVNGTGQTKEEATKNALRSAIEQAFGTFVSANTEVLNDELIKDEITTVSTGNIKSYKELSVSQTSDGLYDASVQATVSIDQLTKFAQSKGMQAELAGAAFVMNMKMRELNKKNEVLAINHLIEKAKAIADKGLFDYKLEIGEPKLIGDSKYEIKLKVLFCENANTIEFYETIDQTFQALSLSEKEKQEYNSAGLNYYQYSRQLNNSTGNITYVLRNNLPTFSDGISILGISLFLPIIMENALNYEIKDNIGNIYYCMRRKMGPLPSAYNPLYEYIAKGNSTCEWYYVDMEGKFLWFYELRPQNRIKSLYYENGVEKYPIIPIMDFNNRKSSLRNVASFYPMIDDWGRQKRNANPNKTYYYQEFFLLYTEEELSKLNSITINHK